MGPFGGCSVLFIYREQIMKGTDIIMALWIVGVVVCRLCHVNGVVTVLAETLSKVAFPYFGVRVWGLMKGKNNK